jgi:transcriptional regulator with XRE-family HTH domain
LKRGTQKKLANKVGISDQMVSFIMSGDRRANWDTAKSISEITGSPVDIWMDQDLPKMREALSEWNPE